MARIYVGLVFLFVVGFWGGDGAAAQGDGVKEYPAPERGFFTIKDFQFDSGETLGELRQSYLTIGKSKRGADGKINNAVLIMHGTTGQAAGFLSDRFAGHLFGEGQLLDANEYFIILTDAVGHGQSSRPSDGLRMKFPKYTYDDMVRAQHQLMTEHLGIERLRLVMGTSMGGMMSWVWGYTYPDFMDALMPLASLPVEIAGRNRMQRKMMMDAIRYDPAWNDGEYDSQPIGLKSATHALIFMISSPLQWQKDAPTRETSEAMLERLVNRFYNNLDANDVIYQFDASRYYNPQPHLGKIKAPLIAINSADDQVNPPELGILEAEIANVKNGRAIVLPITDKTRGHGTHSIPAIWGDHLKDLLEQSAR